MQRGSDANFISKLRASEGKHEPLTLLGDSCIYSHLSCKIMHCMEFNGCFYSGWLMHVFCKSMHALCGV